ncbi:MAG: trehalose-phosphatase, partial [Desulfosarcina sp.]
GQTMKDHGADWVVDDIAEIDRDGLCKHRNAGGLPSALNRIDEISGFDEGRRPVLFLDFDGTLSPIVDRPQDAALAPGMHRALIALAEHCTVAIVSGRGLSDVRERVGLDTLYYAGSHGFEIDGPGQTRLQSDKGIQALPALDRAEAQLKGRLADIDGALVERKKFSVAVHYRKVAPEDAGKVEQIVDGVLGDHADLRKGRGKKVFELQPDVAWDKGHAVQWLMKKLDLDDEMIKPIYIGDDVTDEDAFRVLQGRGAGILVHDGDDRRTYAGYGLETPREVRAFLEDLSAALQGGAR